jgi:LDH2 family malate/lactate/ureidoglycolate dehydrogenase
MPVIAASDLLRLAGRILDAAGVPPAKSAIVAQSLIAANLRGVDSHGIQLLPLYIKQFLAGNVNIHAEGRVASEAGAVMVFDGENAIGQWVAETCCAHAIRMAREHGIAIVAARESNHFGAAAWWASKMKDAGMIGVVMCNASPIVPPWQGREGRVGTNPICMAVPGPWLLDMATTTVAAGKIFKAFFNGQPEIPAGWAFNSEGIPTTDTGEAYKGMLMPLGGYKGSGLAMMVEVLCGVLGGGAMSVAVGGVRLPDRPARTSQSYIAIDISRFMPLEDFAARITELVNTMKSAKPAPGFDEVLVAGDPEWRTETERLRSGIPIPDGNWEALLKAAHSVGLTDPKP